MNLEQLLSEVRKCTICSAHLPLGPKPVVSAERTARILIVGQAPGTRVHQTGIPWNDPSGDNLREWMGVTREQFYDPSIFAIVPMGFCYPGKGKGGDLPPRPECAPAWHQKIIDHLPEIQLTLLIGQYAQKYYLGERCQKNLTETVANYQEYLPEYFPLVHPSPRNIGWRRRNPWFEREVCPSLREIISQLAN